MILTDLYCIAEASPTRPTERPFVRLGRSARARLAAAADVPPTGSFIFILSIGPFMQHTVVSRRPQDGYQHVPIYALCQNGLVLAFV